jgi:predicted transcriptional regulator
MGLTQNDLQEIRSIVQSVVAPVEQKLDVLSGKVEALENDVKEIYEMLAEMRRDQLSTNKFLKLNLEDKILKTYKDIVLTAKQAGVTLPRQ